MHDKDSKEIDLITTIKLIWSKKIFIILSTCLLVGIVFVTSILSPKEYKAKASFFISSKESNDSTLMGYASMFGVTTPSNIEGHIKSILNSYSIKLNIAKLHNSYFETEINAAIQNQSLANDPFEVNNFIINKLRLKDNFSYTTNKDGLFQLSYFSTNRQLAKQILDDYIFQIVLQNKNLELSPEKNLITIIDPPLIPLHPFKPNILLNTILGALVGLFLSSSIVLIYNTIKYS